MASTTSPPRSHAPVHCSPAKPQFYPSNDAENVANGPFLSGNKQSSPKPRISSPTKSHSCSHSRSTLHPSQKPPEAISYEPVFNLTGHTRPVSAVKFSPNGKLIASASSDRTIIIWNALTGQRLHTLEGHLAGISTISWSPNSRHLASGSDDKTIRLWDAIAGTPHPTPFVGHHNYVFSLAFSPKGNMLVSGSYDEAVFLWDVRSGSVMRSLPAHSDPIGGIDFVYDGTIVASCSSDGLIRLWDASTGQCLRTIVHENNAAVTAVKFSPNGKYILAWTLDSSIRLWDYVDGRCIKTYQGHANEKFSISGSFGVYGWKVGSKEEEEVKVEKPGTHGRSHGQTGNTRTQEGTRKNLATANTEFQTPFAFIVSGSEDGAIIFWDVISKRVLQRIPNAHRGAIFAVEAHPSEPMVVSAGEDGVVRVWKDTKLPFLPPSVLTEPEPTFGSHQEQGRELATVSPSKYNSYSNGASFSRPHD